MRRVYFFLATICLVLSLLISTALYAVDEQMPVGAHDTARERIIAPLVNAGVDTSSSDQLRAALSSEDTGIIVSALYLLTENKDESCIIAARRLLGSEYDFVRVKACEYLAVVDKKTNVWRLMAIGLLQSPDDIVKVRSALLLANSNDTQGWPIVRGLLFHSEKELVLEAVVAAQAFIGKKYPQDAIVIDVFTAVADAFAKADAETQLYLIGLLQTTARRENDKVLVDLILKAKSPIASDLLRQMLTTLQKPL